MLLSQKSFNDVAKRAYNTENTGNTAITKNIRKRRIYMRMNDFERSIHYCSELSFQLACQFVYIMDLPFTEHFILGVATQKWYMT